MGAVGHLDDRVDAEAGQHRPVGVAPQHLGVDDLLDGDDHLAARLSGRCRCRARGSSARTGRCRARRRGARGRARRRGRAHGTRRASRRRMDPGRASRFSLMSIRSVPIRPRVGRKGRLRAPAPSRALSAVSDSSSTRIAPVLDRLAVLLAEAELLHRDGRPDEAVDHAGGREPVDGHAADEAHEAEIALLLPDQLAHHRHRRRLRRHVLERHDIAVCDECRRLLDRHYLCHPNPHDLDATVDLHDLAGDVVRAGAESHATSAATSSGWPTRPIGICACTSSSSSAGMPNASPSCAGGREPCLDEARRDRVDVDPKWRPLARERLRQPDHTGLGGRVVGVEGDAVDAVDRRDVHDLAVVRRVLPAQQPGRGAADVERPLERDVEHEIPGLVAHPVQRRVAASGRRC